MIKTISTKIIDWLYIVFIEITINPATDIKSMQMEFNKFINSLKDDQIIMLILTNKPNFNIFNFLQMIILKPSKRIILSYLIDSIETNIKILKKLITIIDKEFKLNNSFNISNEQLAYLMLNIPGLIENLTHDDKANNSILVDSTDMSEEIDIRFRDFITKYPTIKSIFNSNELDS
ncbi:uncharacterized protein KGF55_002414 [Candida pseudojiufengensis]|uniref:uncharacterized protein n=1 Tax=Candida pseudojiufengensis TaxID=497109 RepID=UPI002224591D|nr:uncharacterized protein KGF55_002414 [Candida pseudojiufengensis]KAI5963534.1 hypothetical protein KGF55_002414 [Candida pseudojiufengensis]